MRLRRNFYRGALQARARELTPGGGVTYTYDENDHSARRTPSHHPEWFQTVVNTPNHEV